MGLRTVLCEKKVFSRAKNGMVTKKVKSPIRHDWKWSIMDEVVRNRFEEIDNLDDRFENVLDMDEEADVDTILQKFIDLGSEEDKYDIMDFE